MTGNIFMCPNMLLNPSNREWRFEFSVAALDISVFRVDPGTYGNGERYLAINVKASGHSTVRMGHYKTTKGYYIMM